MNISGNRLPRAATRRRRARIPIACPPLEYPGHFLVKEITTAAPSASSIACSSIANAMVDQRIGCEETEVGVWAVRFNTVLLATFDEHDEIITG